MRINIVIDDQLMSQALTLTGLTTKQAVIEEALRLLIMKYEQQQVRQLRGKLRWEGDLADMREAL
jgi:Arc/MetJ family transcription regulator